MKNIIIPCSCLLLGAQQLGDPSHVCPPALSNDKEAVISELLCLENNNKTMVLQRNSYKRLLHNIRGQDGSDCLALRCINTGELSLELSTVPSQVYIKVMWGSNDSDYITSSEQAKALSFEGIIGAMPRGKVKDTCQEKSLSSFKLINAGTQAVTFKSIKLELRYTDNTHKTIFADTQSRTLKRGASVKISANDILNNQAFISAAVGSCQDN